MVKWISVKDRLPLDYKNVKNFKTRYDIIVALKSGAVIVCDFKCGNMPKPWYVFENQYDVYTKYVTHWMPLPEPPKDTDNIKGDN
jgi:hypothetical protein